MGWPFALVTDDRSRPDQAVGLTSGGIVYTQSRAVVPVTADTRPLKAEVGGLHPVDAAQVVQIFRARALVAALICGEQRLTELGEGLSFQLVKRPDLSDDIGERDAVR